MFCNSLSRCVVWPPSPPPPSLFFHVPPAAICAPVASANSSCQPPNYSTRLLYFHLVTQPAPSISSLDKRRAISATGQQAAQLALSTSKCFYLDARVSPGSARARLAGSGGCDKLFKVGAGSRWKQLREWPAASLSLSNQKCVCTFATQTTRLANYCSSRSKPLG